MIFIDFYSIFLTTTIRLVRRPTDRPTAIQKVEHETGGASIIDGDVEKSIVKTEYSSENHTAEMVPVYSYGYNSSNFTGVYDNTEIFDKLRSIIEK